MLRTVLLAMTIALSGCASFPQWSPEPQDCERWNEGFGKDI